MERRSRLPLRTWVVRVTISSFSAAALMGVAALVTGNEFGRTENQVLLTTLLVGVASVAVLCCLVTVDSAVQPLGVAGGLATVVATGAALLLIWGSFQSEPPEPVLKTFGAGAIAAATLAQSSLLLTVGPRRTHLVVRLLVGTLVFVAALAGLTIALVLGFRPHGSGYPRLVGVVAILDVLGTVVVAALAKFGGRAERAPDLRVPDDLAAQLLAVAEATGRQPEAVLRSALESSLRG